MYVCESDWFTQYGPVKHWVHCKSISHPPIKLACVRYCLLASCIKRLHPDHLLKQSGRLTIDHPFRVTWSMSVAWCIKLYAHGMRPLRFSGVCVWFRDVTSFFDTSGMVYVRVETVSVLTHKTHYPGFGKERWCDAHVDTVLYRCKEKDAERPQSNC